MEITKKIDEYIIIATEVLNTLHIISKSGDDEAIKFKLAKLLGRDYTDIECIIESHKLLDHIGCKIRNSFHETDITKQKGLKNFISSIIADRKPHHYGISEIGFNSIIEVIKVLPEEDQHLLSERFNIYGDPKVRAKTYQEIANNMGISRQGIQTKIKNIGHKLVKYGGIFHILVNDLVFIQTADRSLLDAIAFLPSYKKNEQYISLKYLSSNYRLGQKIVNIMAELGCSDLYDLKETRVSSKVLPSLNEEEIERLLFVCKVFYFTPIA